VVRAQNGDSNNEYRQIVSTHKVKTLLSKSPEAIHIKHLTIQSYIDFFALSSKD